MYTGFDYSPDGNYLLVNNIEKPFSYIVPMNRFPSAYNIYDNNSQFVKLIHKNPLLEIIPKGFSATIKGKRAIQWRDDKAATLFFVEALDEGDPAKEAPFRDALYRWEAPFNNEPNLFFKTKWRFSDIQWTNANFAMVSESWFDTRMSTTFKINPDTIQQEGFIFDSRNYQDVYSDPGNFYTVKNEFNKNVAGVVQNKMYLIGDGFTKEGQFPFIDQYDPIRNVKNRIYTFKSKDKKEDIIDFFDVASNQILVRIESKNEYPNYFFKNIKSHAVQPITNFKNPFLKLNHVYKEVIKYNRKDGVELSGTLYLPEGYDRKSKKQKLPLLIWAYPREFKDKNTAGQVTSNPNAFTFPYYGSFVYWVTKGYAILDNASFPILGEGNKEPNDFFIEQLIDNAHAAIQAVYKLGYIDTQKVAVGGHSYGAFMTANLLTHTNLFKCGIARSGAYNRTLTPFGFQSEQRNYWDIPEVYNKMSPFMNAHKMKTPLLLTHGEADNNPGTFTLQTERYFQALKGLGAPVRMVILPKESHGYLAKENILHLLWEQDQFLEKYLK
jgi:dipeptidyl aminopeptidase/acylaminoacyl peptidase